MRIVTCITRLIRGGAQRIALETAARLTALGHDAPIWCGPETGPEGSLHEEAAARGVRVRIFPRLRRAIDPWADLRVVADLARALADEPPDWLHTHSSKAGIVGREAAARVRRSDRARVHGGAATRADRSADAPAGRLRVVHTVHGWGFTPRTPAGQRWLFVTLERRAARQGRLIFVNPGDLEDGRRLGIVPAGEGRVIAPGIDLAPYRDPAALALRRRETRERFALPADALVGGFLGRLAAQKDPQMVLDVAAALSRELPGLRWLLVGDGPLEGELRRTAAANPALESAVRWAGLVTEPTDSLAAMDFLLLPSRWEGAPLTVVEAMAAGLPLIASDLPGVRWLLAGAPERAEDPTRDTERSPGATRPSPAPHLGTLAPVGATESFIEAVRRLAADPEARRRDGDAARRIALSRMSIDRMLDDLLGLYAS